MCNKVVLLMEKLPKFTQIISGRAKNQTWAVWSQGLCARLLHYAASLKASAEKWSLLKKITNTRPSLLSTIRMLHIILFYLILCLASTVVFTQSALGVYGGWPYFQQH